MRSIIAGIALGIFLAGCSKPDQTADQQPAAPSQSAPDNAGGVAPIGTGATAATTPVGGADNLQGTSAGGIGQTAKDRAKSISQKVSGSSLDQAGE